MNASVWVMGGCEWVRGSGCGSYIWVSECRSKMEGVSLSGCGSEWDMERE